METLLAVCVGLGLAAACGFRVFVPLLVLSIAARAGLVNLTGGFEWMASWTALAAFSVACIAELGGYYVPWVDNALDAIATPAAALAGILVGASQIDGMHPLLEWGTAVIGGGGLATIVQTSTVGARAASTATTAGIANPIVSTAENGASILLSILAVVVPVAAALLLLSAAVWFIRRRFRRRARAAARGTPITARALPAS